MIDTLRRLRAKLAPPLPTSPVRRAPTELVHALPHDGVDAPAPPRHAAGDQRLAALKHPVKALRQNAAKLALRQGMQPLLQVAAEAQAHRDYETAAHFYRGILNTAEARGIDAAWLLSRTDERHPLSPLNQAIARGDVQNALLFLDHGLEPTPLLRDVAFNPNAPPTVMLAANAGMAPVVRRLAETTKRELAVAAARAEGKPAAWRISLSAAERQLYEALFVRRDRAVVDAYFDGDFITAHNKAVAFRHPEAAAWLAEVPQDTLG
jgi:hypothetical protein